MTLLSLCLKI
jgi:hypothetical protein